MDILVIEDDVDIREALLEIFVEHGFDTGQAENGFVALSMLRGGARPRLILLDMMMPVMDGASFRMAQLADPALSTIPVVAMSAHWADLEAADQLRVETRLKKPVDMDTLIAIAEQARPRTP